MSRSDYSFATVWIIGAVSSVLIEHYGGTAFSISTGRGNNRLFDLALSSLDVIPSGHRFTFVIF